ncbi:MAG: outer membrane protein OmpA-like peptidoglycan-associated protein [Spirosomataceae bacterium]
MFCILKEIQSRTQTSYIMNLFEQFDELVTDKLVDKISELVNDTSNNSHKSLKGIFYTLVAGLIRRGNSTMSANMLYNQIQRSGKKGELVDNLELVLKSEQLFETTTNEGNKMLSQVFPAFKSPLISMVSTYSETSKTAAVAYSGLLSALLVDMLNKKIANDNLSAEGLTNYLRQHHQPLLSDSPDGLLDVMIPALGMQELKNVKFAPSKKSSARDENENEVEVPVTIDSDLDYDDLARRRGVSATSLIGIGIVVIGIVLFAWWYFNMRQGATTAFNSDEVATEVPVYEADSADSTDAALAAGNVVEGEYTSFGQELIGYLNDASSESGRVIPMTNVQFLNGTTTVDSSSAFVIDELAGILQKNTQLQIRILGYDVAGNSVIANKRAYTIKRELLDKGVDNNRVDAGGTTTPGENAVSIKVISK